MRGRVHLLRHAAMLRRCVRRSRKFIAAVTAVSVAIALTVVAVAITVASQPSRPAQQQWGTAAGAPHRVSAASALGRVVNGRVVPAGTHLPGPVTPQPSGLVKGAVPAAKRPVALRFPVTGKGAESTHVLRAPAAAKITGYNPKTSRELPPTEPDQSTYANTDGTKTTFNFQAPVNYRQPDGRWVPINTTLVPVSGSTSFISPSPSPTSSPSPSPSPSAGSSAGSSSGWTEKSAAVPVTFAADGNAADLATIPLDGSHAVSFGLEGAAAAPGTTQGNEVTYAQVLGGSDLRLAAGSGMVKEQIVLHSPNAPDTWVFPLHLTGLHAQVSTGGTIEFADASGKVLAYIPHGSMMDAKIDPHSGDGAMSDGVTYALITVNGGQAIKMTLDSAWLNDKARVFPVTVDPSVSSVTSNGSTFAQTGETGDNSGVNEVHVGTWDGGSDIAEAYLKFDNVSSSLKNDTVLGVRLGLFNSWSYSCSPRTVYVYPVTGSWTPSGVSWPGPSTGQAIGRKSFATGWVQLGSTVSPCPASWEGIDLDQAGTNLVNGWTHGTIANNGLALGASHSDSYAWKKFTSYATTTGQPFLSVTYTPDGASYRLASSKPVKQVWPNQNGTFAIKVTNTGSSTWTTSNGYELSYRAYNSAGKLAADHPVFTPMPSTVAPGATVTVNATVDELPAGTYALDFDMYSAATGSSPVSFSSQGIPPFAVGLYIPQPPPTVTAVYPPTGYISPTTTPQLSTSAFASTGGTVTYQFTLTCAPIAGTVCPAGVIGSGTLSVPYWTPPGAMTWNEPYTWTVTATVNGASTTVGPITITPEVPQPDIMSGLGTSSGQAFDPQSGNYTTSATDAAVATIGPPLQINRTYNSADPRTTGGFGAGWSSQLDASVVADNDGSGNVVVTTPNGQQMRFGNNGTSTYAPPMGNPDALVKNSDGSWGLMDSSGDTYKFTAAGLLSQIIDPNGQVQAFTDNSSGEATTITNTASARALHLTWSTTGGTHPHVTSVSTDPPASGQSGFTWTYGYTGDELTQVCAPSGGCTSYTYGSGSAYRSAVLDSGPRSYWQFGEASGATSAADEVDANLGTTDGTYSNATLGAAGPLAGSSETAAGFDGTSSDVTLPANLITDGTNVTVELWFKAGTSTASGVLFAYAADALTSSTGNTDHHDPALYVGSNGYLYGEFYNGSINPIHTNASVDDGNWHYAVLSANSTTQSLYLDGTLVGTLSGQINQMNMTHDTVGAGFWQGGWPADYTIQGPISTATPIGYYDGDIAQVAVYPHPLGQSAITAHYGLRAAPTAQLTQVTMPSGRVYEQASYDPATGRLATYTDPNGGQWTIHQPIATGYQATSDSLGVVIRSVTVADPAGRDEVYGYDALDGGRLVSYNNGVDAPRSFGYDAAGNLASVSDEDGNQVCLTNDIHGNVLTRTWYSAQPATVLGGGVGTVTNCAGSTASSPTCATTGAPCTTFYSYYYDAANPLDPENNKLTGVRDGRSASATSNTYLTAYAYNKAGQLTSQTTPATSDFPSGRTTSYSYSAGTEAAYNNSAATIPAGLLLSQTTPGNAVTSYEYYANGDLARVNEPSGRYTVYTYDALGRPATSTVYTSSFSSGLTTSYSYNATGQPVTVTHPGVPNSLANVTHTLQDSYAYDSDGNLQKATEADLTGSDPTRVTSYTYDDHGQVATVTKPDGATTGGSAQTGGAASPYPAGATTSYTYDPFGNVATMTDPDGNVYDYTYNEYNEQTQVTLHTTSSSQANPVANCTLPAIQAADGGCDLVLDSYAYDPAGQLAAVKDAMGRITNYTYDFNQDLIAVTQTDASTTPTTGRQTTYSYDGAGNLVRQAVSAMSGGSVGTSTVTNYTVDAADRVTSQLVDPTPSGTSASGYVNRTTAYTYNADDYVKSQTVSDSSGSSVTDYGYDTAGDLTSQTVVDGSTSLDTSWTYDQNGQPLSMTTPRGNASGATAANYTTNYTYDQAGELATVTGAPVPVQTYSAQTAVTSRPLTTYGYDTFGDQTQAKDPDNNVTVTGYDAAGRVTSVTQPSYTPPGTTTAITATTQYAYDEAGNLASVTDPAKNVTSYGYDALGDVTSRTDPLLPGQSAPGTWAYTYDAAGEPLSATSPLKEETSETWDYFGNQKTSTDALQHTTSYLHDYLGDQTQVSTPDGSVTKSTYDHLGELSTVVDAYGNTTSYSYNYAGQVSQVNNPDSSFSQNTYDEAGRLTGVADFPATPAGQAATQLRSETIGYDPDGNQTSVKDWNGNTTNYNYDAAGQLTSTVQPVTSSLSITTGQGYDAAGNQTAVTGGKGNTTWTTYNSWNQPESVIEPATEAASAAADRTWTTAYDQNGRPATVTQPGGISVTYGYNPLGELNAQSGSGAAAPTSALSFGYDLDGRMTSAVTPAGTDTFTPNANGQLSAASGPSGTSGVGYNNDGLVSSETSPAGAASYTYDSADRLSTVADPLTGATLTYGYNANSQPNSIAYSVGGASGPKQTLGYDALNRLASDTLDSASGATIASQSWGYDNNDNLTSQTTTGMAGAGSISYGYDQANRLASTTTGGTTTSYSFDNDGNLTGAGGTTYNYNAQDQATSQVSGAGTTGYGYTLSGALASVTPPGGTAQTYTSNAYGQTVTAPGGVGYGYDALGRLVTRTTSSGTSNLSWLGTSSSLTSDGTSNYSYAPDGSLVAAQTGTAAASVALANVHGDVTGLFSPVSGTSGLAASTAYSPYGSVTASSGTMPSVGYQGDYTDPSTGQVDMNARWFSPSTGGFTSNDTIAGSPLSSTVDGNPYAYAAGDPLTTTDPTGYLKCGVCTDVGRGLTRSYEDVSGWLNDGAEAVADNPVVDEIGEDADPATAGIAFVQIFWPATPQGEATQGTCGPGTSIPSCGWAADPGAPPILGLEPGWGTSTSPDYGISGASRIGTGGAGPGPCTIVTCPPPPPPPPPQDIYAEGAQAPAAPHALRFSPWITRTVQDITSAAGLFRNGKGVRETAPVSHVTPAGTGSNPLANGDPFANLNTALDQLIKDIHDFHPTAPHAPVPAPTKRPGAVGTGTGSGSSAAGAGSGGGGECTTPGCPPPSPNLGPASNTSAGTTSGGTVVETSQAPATATAGGSSGQSGGGTPPTSNGSACEPNGQFSINDWTGYPQGVPRPSGPFNLVRGAAYQAARKAANKANAALRGSSGFRGLGSMVQVHEIQPVKFGGSPTDIANKIVVSDQQHTALNNFWNNMQNYAEGC